MTYELSDEYQGLVENVISNEPTLAHLGVYGCAIACMKADKHKKKGNHIVYADTEKVKDKFHRLTGIDFVITFYLDADTLTDDQKYILAYHELLHIGYTEDKLRSIKDHDLIDFREIVNKYGVDWVVHEEDM